MTVGMFSDVGQRVRSEEQVVLTVGEMGNWQRHVVVDKEYTGE